MDTVSMLNTMSFYCQPILPLVYDESMSYYETLCKVVGQLNTTGDAVNKLNEGLTNEISDRQAADAALDERLKQIEELNGRIHFLVFADANPSRAMPTRSELYNWVRNGDAIYTLLSTNEAGRGQVYAASCTYNAGNWGSEASNDFNIIVPLETKYDSANDYAVKQKVAKLTIPSISHTSLNAPWGLQIIEINTPYTTAEGVVNVIAVVSDSGSVNCSITPSEFLQLYNTTRGGKNLCVAVNAKLAYDGLARSSSIATVDTTNRIVRIAFERDYGTAITNGVNQLNKTLDYIIGDAKTGTWVHETIDSKIFDFIRYEGFQFTRGAHDVITTDDESTPNAVYAQYHSDTSGKLYQNLPTRLIDSVDGAEYWNGTFDIYGGNHMTFTFVTSNYATASGKMLVRVIELSADVGTTEWKYGVKEFTLPLDTSYKVVTYTASKVGEGEYSAAKHKTEYTVDFAEGVPAIIASIEAGNRVILRVDLKELGSESGTSPLYFASGYTRVDVFANAISYIFSGSITNGHYTLEFNSALAQATLSYYGEVLPVPNPDASDNGKVPTVNGTAWELKDQNSKPLYITIDVANIDDRIYTLTDGNKPYTVEEIYAAKENGTPVFIAPADIGSYFQVLDFSFSNTAFKAFFLNVVRRTDMSYGRLIISTIGGQTKGTYNAEGFLAASSGANNGKFLKMKQDGSGIEYVDGSTANAILYTPQTLTDAQKKQARENVDAASDFVVNATPNLNLTLTLDKTWAQINEAVNAGKTPVMVMPYGDYDSVRLQLLDIRTDGTAMVFSNVGAITGGTLAVTATVRSNGINSYSVGSLLGTGLDGVLPQISMASAPASDMQIATKKYVDDNKGSAEVVEYTEQTLTNPQKLQARKNIDALGSVAPNIKHHVIITPPNEADGIGVSLSASGTGGDFTLDISDANGNQPTKLTGVKTPTDADTNAAATVQYVLNKAKKKVWIDVVTEEVKTFNYTDIDNEITSGGSNVWLNLGTEQLRMVACNKTGASSYVLTFVNLSGAYFNIHSVTVSASAAEYTVITK